MSIFCPDCGSENSDDAERCQSCGRMLDDDAVQEVERRSRPMRWTLVATMAGITTTLVTFFYIIGLSIVIRPDTIIWQDPDTDQIGTDPVIIADGSMILILGPLAAFILGAFVSALASRGRHLAEVAIGAGVAVLAQMCMWAISLGSAVTTIGSATIQLAGQSSHFSGKAFLLLPFFLILFMFTAIVVAITIWVVIEQITGKTACLYCRQMLPIRPRVPPRCPKCEAPQEATGVQWPVVMVATTMTAVIFVLVLTYLGPILGHYYYCDPIEPTDICRETFEEARVDDAWMYFINTRDRDNAHLILLHKWKYLGFMAILFLLSPTLVAWFSKRGNLPTAGVVIGLNWAICSMVALVMVAFSGGFEAAYVWMIRFHVLALIAWGIAGFVGAMIGSKIHYRSGKAYLGEID